VAISSDVSARFMICSGAWRIIQRDCFT
jgi:hypothetical protein